MPYCQLYYHLVWATKDREPRLVPECEAVIYNFLRTKAIGLGGFVYALNGTEDHVHLVVSIPPRVAVSTFVGQVKGVATARFNKLSRQPPLYWQEEYGAFTFDYKRLPHVVEYVEQQKEHHARQSLIPVLERTDEEPIRLPIFREPPAVYAVDGEREAWWGEMVAMG